LKKDKPKKEIAEQSAPSRSRFSKAAKPSDRPKPFPNRDRQGATPPRPGTKKEDAPSRSRFSKAGVAGPKNRPSAGTPPTSKGPKELLKTLDRILSKSGLGSRTEARSWIGTGRVRVNGLLVQTPDYWVNPKTDKVLLDDKPIDLVERRYILLNKPKGYLTTYKDPENRPTVYDLLKGIDQFLSTVGRLDLDTSGLLLMTNDNDLCEAVTNPAYKLEKTYLVKAATLLSEEQLDRLRQGVELDDGITKPAEVSVLRTSEKHTFFEITITEGRNRQIRRMLEAVDSRALKLVRVKLGPLTLEGLPIGTWRDLTEAEVARLTSGMARPKKTSAESDG
jgi:pseudouridine synthase